MQEHVPLTPSVTLDPFVRWFLDTPTHQPLLVIDTFVRSGPGIRPVQADMGGIDGCGHPEHPEQSWHPVDLPSGRLFWTCGVGAGVTEEDAGRASDRRQAWWAPWLRFSWPSFGTFTLCPHGPSHAGAWESCRDGEPKG